MNSGILALSSIAVVAVVVTDTKAAQEGLLNREGINYQISYKAITLGKYLHTTLLYIQFILNL